MATILKASVTSDFGVKGVETGIQIIEAVNRGYAVARNLLTEVAVELSGLAQQSTDFLAGYALAYVKAGKSEAGARVRKSEAHMIFQAAHILITKMDKPQAQAKLEAIQGDFHSYVDQCRDIIKLENGEKTRSGKSTEPKKLQADDLIKIGKRLTKSSAGTALGLIEAATKVYIQSAGNPEGLVERMSDFAVELAKVSDKYYANLGKKIAEMTQKAREHAATEKARMLLEEQKRVDKETAKAKADAKKPAAKPTPAVAASPETIAALEAEANKSDEQLEQDIAAQEQS